MYDVAGGGEGGADGIYGGVGAGGAAGREIDACGGVGAEVADCLEAEAGVAYWILVKLLGL